MIIRATQKKMMSKPVTSALEGRNSSNPRSAMAASSGQPRVLNGHSAEENQVSSTSLSWRSGTSAASPERARASASSRPTWMLPASSYQAGIRWPHQSWRLIVQSWMFSIQWR